MAGSEVGSVQITFGFDEGEFIRDVSEAENFNSSDLQGSDVVPLIVGHGEEFSHVLDRFAFVFIFVKKSRSRSFVAVEDESDQTVSHLSGVPEFDRTESIDEWKHAETLDQRLFGLNVSQSSVSNRNE